MEAQNHTNIEDFSKVKLMELLNDLRSCFTSSLFFRASLDSQLKKDVIRRGDFDNILHIIVDKVSDEKTFESILKKRLDEGRGKEVELERIFINSFHIYSINLCIESSSFFDLLRPIYLGNLIFNKLKGADPSNKIKLSHANFTDSLGGIEKIYINNKVKEFFSISREQLMYFFWRSCCALSLYEGYKNNLYYLNFLIILIEKLKFFKTIHFGKDNKDNFKAQSKGGYTRAKNLAEDREPIFEELKNLWDTGKWNKASTFSSDVHDLEGINLPYNTVYNFIRKYKNNKC
ncbi:hypothetical protein ACG94V_13755 [Acinetobacter sp. ULE_I001]|uniref:hypothetical protein n=1 Tax=unclassified Acinetobacter TaxID=196816 RepID=UPI003AF6FBA0